MASPTDKKQQGEGELRTLQFQCPKPGCKFVGSSKYNLKKHMRKHA